MPTLEINGKLFAEQSGTGPVKLKIDELTESTANAGIRLTHPLKSSAGDDIMTADGALHNINFDNVANNAISGDKIHGGIISGFSSTGIQDNANNVAITIDSSGNVGIGTALADPIGSNADGVSLSQNYRRFHSTTSESTISLGTSSSNLLGFHYHNGTSYQGMKGSITTDGLGVTYNTTSDRRLKENIKTITDGTSKLMAMNPVTHTWISNPDAPAVHSFIAQEMQYVVPEAVLGEDGGEEMMSMDYGRITPIIVAALQDALKEIDVLKTRISELESKQ